MSFEKGPINVTMFKLNKKLPENYLEFFAAYSAGKLEDIRDKKQLGWTSGYSLLGTIIDESTAICGGHLYLNLRRAERKIPSVMLAELCKIAELRYMQSGKIDFVPSKIKRDIRAEEKERVLPKITPTFSGIPLVIDLAENILYAGTTSQGQIDDLLCFFFKTTGVEPVQINISTLCQELGIQEADLPSIQFSEHEKSGDLTPGRDFLTWLWYFSEKFSNEILIEGPLTFAAADEARGAHDIAIKKGGCPTRSAEAKSALIIGKKLKKATISLVNSNDVWSCTFDADKFSFSSLSLPEGEEMDLHSRFQERIQNLDIFRQAIQSYFIKFVDTVRSLNQKWPETEKAIQAWVLNRDSY